MVFMKKMVMNISSPLVLRTLFCGHLCLLVKITSTYPASPVILFFFFSVPAYIKSFNFLLEGNPLSISNVPTQRLYESKYSFHCTNFAKSSKLLMHMVITGCLP